MDVDISGALALARHFLKHPIHRANRSWRSTSWRGPVAGNRYFGWISLATLALLGAMLVLAPIRRLFAFAAPSPAVLLAGAGVSLLSLLWFEAVKRMLDRHR